MDSELGQSVRQTPQNPSCSGSGDRNDMANFNCSICLDLAQDPIVTLCGHLYCWPCLYKWFGYLGTHSLPQECPVCKALVQEDKLVPLYGRGKTSADDPRLKSIPETDIPNRPEAQRPETANRAPNMNQFPPLDFGFMGGDTPIANVTVNSFTFIYTTTPSHPTSQWLQDIAGKIPLLLVIFVILSLIWFWFC
ncbi:hypothetical protein MKW92_002810 [Papaver armeniacum]|nr:hypothetical protein MKW92_028892 [Papaver armeniacum]KAI3965301.1 hypothetical protein MKW92_002810 [Papaver armeniacum]